MEKGVIRGIYERKAVCEVIEQEKTTPQHCPDQPQKPRGKKGMSVLFYYFRPVYYFILGYEGKYKKRVTWICSKYFVEIHVLYTRRGGLFTRVSHVLHVTSVYTCIKRCHFTRSQ